MNGAPGGRQQCGATPQKQRDPAFRVPQQHLNTATTTTGTIFPQPDDAAPNGQPVCHTIPPSQALTLAASSSTQQPPMGSVRGELPSLALPILQSSTLQHPGGWPPQFDLQSLYSAQQSALRFNQQQQQVAAAVVAAGRSHSSHISQSGSGAAQPQPSPLTVPLTSQTAAQLSQSQQQGTQQQQTSSSELSALCASPRSCSLSVSPANVPQQSSGTSNTITPTTGTSLIAGMACGSTSGTSGGGGGMLTSGTAASLNPAFLAQYQLLIAAAAQQQQHVAAAAAAALAAASAAHQSSIGTRMSTSPVSSLAPFEHNLQRYMLQLQQQQQLAHGMPSSSLHTPSPLPAHMHSAAQLQPSFPQSSHVVQQVPGQSRTSCVDSPTGSSVVGVGSRGSGAESQQPHQQSLLARLAQRHSSCSLSMTGSSPSTATLPPSSSSTLHSRFAQNRGSLMPPPPLPRSRHASISLPSTSQIRQRPSALPYQRPAPSMDVPFEMGTLASHPYYPSHFMRGTVIQLQSGQLKRVEEMNTSDFVLSAAMKSDLSLCNSTVVNIHEVDKDLRHVLVTFAVAPHNIQVSIEAGVEHPYFVVGQGWASYSPEKTRNTYGLTCKRLAVGDVCITIRHTDKRDSTACGGGGSPASVSSVSAVTRLLVASPGGELLLEGAAARRASDEPSASTSSPTVVTAAGWRSAPPATAPFHREHPARPPRRKSST